MGPVAHTLSYPQTSSLRQADRQQYKLKIKKENPEKLFKDSSNSKGKNHHHKPALLHRTPNCMAHSFLHTAPISHQNMGSVEADNCAFMRTQTKTQRNRHLTINFYQNGTVMIQGNNAALTNFEQTFQCLKEMVERDEANPCEQNHSDTPEDTDQNEPSTHNNKKNRTTPETTENISLPQAQDYTTQSISYNTA